MPTTASSRSPTSASGGRSETGLPVPLAGSAPGPTSTSDVDAAEAAIRASVEYAFAHPEASRDYVRAHSQEMSDEVCDQHIALYVNEFSVDLGDEGYGGDRAAAPALPRLACMPAPSSFPPFARRSAATAAGSPRCGRTISRRSAIAAAVERAGVPAGEIEDVWFGCANQAGEDNRNVARMAALLAGLPDSVAGVTVNRLCASGLSAVVGAATR